jgi:hypothetical protein
MYGGAPMFSPAPPPSSGQLTTSPTMSPNTIGSDTPNLSGDAPSAQPGVAGGSLPPR